MNIRNKMKLHNALYGLLCGFGVTTSLAAMDGQRQYTCQQCQISPEKIVRVSKFLRSSGYRPSDLFAGESIATTEELPDAYYCQQHEDTPITADIIDKFKQECLGGYPHTKWNEPFPQYNARKELIDNPIVVHGGHAEGVKYPVSKYVPLGIIGLVAVGAIYYYWSSGKKEKDDDEDEEEEQETDETNRGQNEIA